MDSVFKSATGTMSSETMNVERVNPTSEKPKFGRGTLTFEMKKVKGTRCVQINGCHREIGTEHGL